jgi:uncharacterized protein YaiL (DUF2058 family)
MTPEENQAYIKSLVERDRLRALNAEMVKAFHELYKISNLNITEDQVRTLIRRTVSEALSKVEKG